MIPCQLANSYHCFRRAGCVHLQGLCNW